MSGKLVYIDDVEQALDKAYGEGNLLGLGRFLKNVSAVDAVEVVRCYKCKHWEPMNKGSWMCRNRTDGVCRTLMEFRLAERYMTEKDHFCGFGERREEDEID